MADAPLRVLWLVKGLGLGGAEQLLVEHARAGDRQRFVYEAAYLLPWKDRVVADLEALGVATHCLSVRTPADPRWLLRLGALLREREFDVLHAHSPLVAAAARPLARMRRHRPAFVYTEHNRWPSHHPLTRLVNRATFGMNDAVVVVSDDVAASLPTELRSRAEVVRHGIDVERVAALRADRAAVRAELGVTPEQVLVVTVANLRATKGYPELLAAARRVLDAGLPVRFVAAGQGPMEAELRELQRELGIGDDFRFLGFRADATRLMAGADVFALGSRHEGLPVSVMEAMALGLPVVAPDVGGLSEAVTTGESGLLTTPGDVVALAAAIERLARDPAERARLGAAAGGAAAQLDSARSVARLEAIYLEVADRVSGARRRGIRAVP